MKKTMKSMKITVLTATLALGVSASAAASNPFTEVPAGHWAYDSVSKLVASGVVEGYGDGVFCGDKLLTRYEMAQIVAKAMAKGANVDKLAGEFAAELDSLGVRVANLEKKSDRVRFWGQLRGHYDSHHRSGSKKVSTDTSSARTRIWLEGQINENWVYQSMIQNEQIFDDGKGNEEIKYMRSFVKGRLGGMTVVAGRWGEDISPMVIDTHMEGVKLSYGTSKWNGVAMFTKAAGPHSTLTGSDRLNIFGVAANWGKGYGFVNYYNATNAPIICKENPDDNWYDKENSIGGDKDILNVGVGVKPWKNVLLFGEYMRGMRDLDNRVGRNGYVARIQYRDIKASDPGSFLLVANYYHQPVNGFLMPTISANKWLFEGGYKGYNLGAKYIVAKNIQAQVDYFDTKSMVGDNRDKVLVTEVYFYF